MGRHALHNEAEAQARLDDSGPYPHHKRRGAHHGRGTYPNEEIALCLDGEQQSPYNYDSGTGKLTYTVQGYQQLSLGTHSARVTAYDLEVGMRATKEWTFRVAQRK